METGGVAASVAVGHSAVAQADLLHLHVRRKPGLHQLPQRQRVGRGALGGVERQHVPDGRGLFPRIQPGDQLRQRRVEGRDLVRAADLRLGAEIAQGAGGLHQWAADEAAARLIGGEHHVPRHVLGVKLAHAGDDAPGGAALQQVAAAAQAGEHPVIGHIAAALVQRHGEQQTAAVQTVQPGVRVAYLAAGGQQRLQQLPQGGAAVVFGKQYGEHGVSPPRCFVIPSR